RLQVRNFTVKEIYDGLSDVAGSPVVLASFEDLRRVNGWEEGRASALEITLHDRYRSTEREKATAVELAGTAYGLSKDEDDPLLAVASVDKYYNLFAWLDLIDFNVGVILLLMILVAGFNMISGLLILLFRNIPTIGTLKALGMSDRGIAGVFLRVSARVVLKGMLIGNAAALLFAIVQHFTHFIHLNPENYFVSFVPVSVNLLQILTVDSVAFAAIMLMMLLPSLFIARVDPADTVRVK
nr:FtsX-like permease family protein [Bacteroidales bacterium]